MFLFTCFAEINYSTNNAFLNSILDKKKHVFQISLLTKALTHVSRFVCICKYFVAATLTIHTYPAKNKATTTNFSKCSVEWKLLKMLSKVETFEKLLSRVETFENVTKFFWIQTNPDTCRRGLI